eukprot:110013_1
MYGDVFFAFVAIGIIVLLILTSGIIYQVFISKWALFCHYMICSKHKMFVLVTTVEEFEQECTKICKLFENDVLPAAETIQSPWQWSFVSKDDMRNKEISGTVPACCFGLLSVAIIISVAFINQQHFDDNCHTVDGFILQYSVGMALIIAFLGMEIYIKQNRMVLLLVSGTVFSLLSSFITTYIYMINYYQHKHCDRNYNALLLIQLVGVFFCSILLNWRCKLPNCKDKCNCRLGNSQNKIAKIRNDIYTGSVYVPNKGFIKITNNVEMTTAKKNDFLFDKEDLVNLMSFFQDLPKAIALLSQMGGIPGIAYALCSNIISGLEHDEVKDKDAFMHRRSLYGTNVMPKPVPITIAKIFLKQIRHSFSITLIAVTITSIFTTSWFDGIAVLFVVIAVICINILYEYRVEKIKHHMTSKQRENLCTVIRAGKEKIVSDVNLVVGDLLILRVGCIVPADGIFVDPMFIFLCNDLVDQHYHKPYIHNNMTLEVQQYSLTGEFLKVAKSRLDPFIMAGSHVVSGSASMIVVAVGNSSRKVYIATKLKPNSRDELQDQIQLYDAQISNGGSVIALAIFSINIVHWVMEDISIGSLSISSLCLIASVIGFLTVHGKLRNALWCCMKKMMSQNDFRWKESFQSTGISTVCVDKTGISNSNEIEVEKCHFFGTECFNALQIENYVDESVYQRIVIESCLNSTTSIKDHDMMQFTRGSNHIDYAILKWMVNLGVKYQEIRKNHRIFKFFLYDSAVQRSAILISEKENLFECALYVKGAVIKILNLCSRKLDTKGNVSDMTKKDRETISKEIEYMTKAGLCCLGFCYRLFATQDIPWKSTTWKTLENDDAESIFSVHDMIWICSIGIRHTINPELIDTIRKCQTAGIVMTMITGDHLNTATYVANQIGLVRSDQDIYITSSEFHFLSTTQKNVILPRIRLLADAKPSDKEELVNWYEANNRLSGTVAITGDIAKDVPNSAESSAIVVFDGNFESIEQKIIQGQFIYDNIRKFLQFYLTVILVVLFISLIGAFYKSWYNLFTVVQTLWIGVFISPLAVLGLTTENPSKSLVNHQSYKRNAQLITPIVWRFVLGHLVYQLVVLLLTITRGNNWLHIKEEDYESTISNIVFNMLFWLQIFNAINARKVHNERNVFQGIHKNLSWWCVVISSVATQIILVQLLGKSLNVVEWFYCIGLSIGILVWHQVIVTFSVGK